LASIVTSENEFCQNLMSQDTITTADSEVYDSIGGHKYSLDQDTSTHRFVRGHHWWLPDREAEISPITGFVRKSLAALDGRFKSQKLTHKVPLSTHGGL
jgi:hypothetical protein